MPVDTLERHSLINEAGAVQGVAVALVGMLAAADHALPVSAVSTVTALEQKVVALKARIVAEAGD